MKELKKKSILFQLSMALVFLVIGVFVLIAGINGLSESKEEPIELSEVDFTQDIDDLYVTTELDIIYDVYGEVTKNGNVVEYEYLIDANEIYYIGLRVDADESRQADNLLQATYDYIIGNIDETELKKSTFTIEGTIHKMEDEMLAVYHEYVG